MMANRDQFNRGMILPTLIKHLRSILHQYPDDGQILKELIQNAEDAKAKKIVFLLDSTSYSAQAEKLHHPDLAAYQGPALYVYNDAVFSSDDWKGITMLSDSVKEKDPMKVGRFGLGFKSVFHLTDLPSIFSGNGIGFLDPHERFFRNDCGYPISAYLWELNENKETMERLQDQFLPYFQSLFVVTKETFDRGFYEGTMFRFPLRMDGMQSDLSDTKYSPEKVGELFRSLETDAHIMLLFLKSLECIEVYEKTSNTEENPVKILSISISNTVRESVREKRQQLIKEIEAQRNGNISRPISVTYTLNVDLQRHRETETLETTQWVVSQYYAGRSELGPAGGISEDLGLLPWVGVALPVSSDQTEIPSYLTTPRGHIFCFLPLPLEEDSPTGLRVHVHGYFAVDSNRRHIKWPTADQKPDQLTDKDLLWNMFLVNTLTAKALVNLALHVSNPSNCLRHDLVFDIIPDHVTPQWKQLAENFHRELPKLNVFHSPSSGGKWMNCRDALFDNCEDRSICQELIRRILIQNQESFVSVPLFLKKHFANQLSPSNICAAFKATQTTLALSEQEKFLLLEYFLDSFPNGTELVGIKLVPLEDGTWTDFKQHCGEKVYIESADHKKYILPNMEKLFLRQSIPVLEKMKTLAHKNVTQLTHFGPEVVAALLSSVFPQHWSCVDEVDLASAAHLSHEWLTDLWPYLKKYFPSTLHWFENLLILPIGNGQVRRLKSDTPVVLASHYGTILPSETKSVLKTLGLKVIDELPSVVLDHQNLIGIYVLAPDVSSVLSAMNRLYHQGRLPIYSLNDSDKISLQTFLISALAGKPKVISDYKNLLTNLPVFKTLATNSEYVSLVAVNQGAPPDMNLPVELPTKFIDLRENLVRDLAIHLGVIQKRVAVILESCVFPAVNNGYYGLDSIRTLMSYVCDNFSRFQKESRKNFCSFMSNVRFVQKQNQSTVVTPGEVFDKSDQTLCLLFSCDDVFPVGEFASSKYAHVLRQLGLKSQNSVTAADLLSIAENLHCSSVPDLARAHNFLKFLESNSHLLTQSVNRNYSNTSLSGALSELRWVKPDSNRPFNYAKSLEYFGEAKSKQLLLPRDVWSSQFSFVVGSVKSTVDVSKTPKVANCFQWSNQPGVDEVVQHLFNVVSAFSPAQGNEFQLILKAVYKFLNESIARSNCGTKLNDLTQLNWIWTGEKLVSPDKVVKTKPFVDLQPHVYQLPTDVKEFSHLWNFFRVAETVDMIRILKEIHSLHTTSVCDQSQAKRDIGLAVAILNNISTVKNGDEFLEELLVPVRTDDENVLCMKPIQEVTYCDKEWYQRSFEVHDLVDHDVYLVHPLLSPETAEALKIHGVISRVLGAEELGFESYGQFEGLTTRLNSILKDYTDGMAVLKELVQNADDAGATEVKFLYDQRQNKDSRTLLFDKGMAELQGPALWAYNDAVFTREDFENLVKLSGATKEGKNEKIGRFGLGFNAVYNLTDAPSLVSRNHAVFLDPHTRYLGRAIRDKTKPGIKIDIKDSRRKLQALSDQFRPYNGIFGFDLSKDIGHNTNNNSDGSRKDFYPGTLFRFPLRTAQQADTSDICKKCYSHQELMTLLELLGRSGQHLLLFTQNVSKISVFHLPDNASPDGMEEWFTVEKSLTQTVRSLNRNSQSLLNDSSELSRECSILKVASSVLKPSANASEMPKLESSLVIKVACRTSTKFPNLPAAAASGSEIISETFWLVTSCLGRGGSLTMARGYNDLIPVGGMAAKLRRIDDGCYEPINLEDSGLVFCFLPLPIRSCFPVHVNGSFALTSSRTHLYENTVEDKLDRRSQWNEALVKDAITEAYLVLLEDLLAVCPNCNSYALWPTHKSLKEAGWFSMLTDTLYRRIFDKEVKIVRENGRLLSMSECRYLEPSFRAGTVGETALSVFRKMASLDFQVTDIPVGVYETATETTASQQLETRKIAKSEFFERFFLPNIHTVEAEQRDQLTLYALFDQNLIRLLQNVACVPVKPRQNLKACAQLVHPHSFLAVLFDEEDDCFPDFKAISGFRPSDIHGKLIELGMREQDLSWRETVERCKVVTKIEDLAAKRLEAILRLMSSKASSVADVDFPFVEQIKAIQFLPTAAKPIGFPLRWKADDVKYASCNESYLSNVKNLVCCLHPIVNDHKIFGYDNQRLKALLGLADRQIQQGDLLLQFGEVLQSSGSVKGLAVDGAIHVKEICAELYRRFEELASRNELLQATIDELSNMQIILVDGSMAFMSPRNCAFTLGVPSESLLPYLAQVPRSMTTMRYLLDKLQIKQRFQLEDYTSVLQQLHAKSNGEPLKPDELQMVLCIVNTCLVSEIANFPAGSGEVSLDQSTIYVPDARGILHPVKSLCYNNCPWIETIDHHFCSDGVTPRAAMAIGMKTIREDVLDRHSIGLPFGQREKLVSRIRRILSGYPFDKELLKEMLQNADDAKATAIHFINDRRQLKTERVFEDRWKPLQGPALCIFNDKPFTQQDIVGIQNLGEGSKSEDPTKTGQYGVGFNCVYHVTEAPTFLTDVVGDGDSVERVLCAFDPTFKFVPGASEANPGRMMKNIEELKRRFPDVFEGYFEKDYGSLGGTMFRLSLRDEKIAEKPDCVTNKPVTSDDIDALFATFKTDMYESLLFLNSVEEIHLRNSDSSGNLATEYVVQVEMTAEVKEKRMQFGEKVASLARALRAKEISLKNVGLTEISYELVTKDNDGEKDTWQVVQRFGFEDPGCVPESLGDAYATGDIGLLPRCGVAYLKDTTRKKVDDRNHRRRRLFCFLPLPIPIGFPAHVNGHFALDYEARRNLWSDERGGYKTEWNRCMMSHVAAPCYCSLLLEKRDSFIGQGPVTQATVSQYNALFPSIDSADGPYMQALSKAIYERIAKKNLAVFPARWPAQENRHLWIGPRGMDESTWKMWRDMGWNGPTGTNGTLGYFDDLCNQIYEPPEPPLGLGYRGGFYPTAGNVKIESKKQNHEIVRETLVASGFLLINCPVSIARNFKAAQAEAKIVSPDAVLSFFATYGQPDGLCRLEGLPRHLTETLFKDVKTMRLLMEYCTGSDNFKGRLLDLPLLLTADQHLRCFSREAVKYEPRFRDTVPHIQHQFIDNGIFHAMRLDAKVDKHLCRAFTVEEFAGALPSLLPPDKFKTAEGFVSVQTLIDTLKDNYLKWLVHLWTFLYKCKQEQASQTHSNQAMESLKNTILPLSDWCLLPVTFRQQEWLFPMQKSRSVINFSWHVLQQTLNDCLRKIGIPQPLFKYFPASYAYENEPLEMYCQLLGTADNASSVVQALEEVVKCGPVEAELNSSECEELCKYLAKSLDGWKEIPNSIDTVRQLPIFTTMYKKQVALMTSCVYVIQSCIPILDMESWTARRGIVFLKENADFLQLFKFLGCTILSETEVYCGYIFKHFEMLSADGQKVHLMYVKDRLLENLSKKPHGETAEHQQEREQAFNALMESLTILAFIPRGDGSYARAGEFFDNQEEVFKSMQEPSDFPPEPYNSWEWNDFLKKCGMISVVSQTLFLDYARQIEQKSQVMINDDLRKQSGILVDHLFSKEDDLKNTTFMNSVKIIKFVEPYTLGDDRKTLHDGCGKKNENGQNMFICFKNSITREHADLIWTVQNVLPCSVYTYSTLGRQALNGLEVEIEPKPEKVAEHVRRLCMKWESATPRLEPHAEVMADVLKKCYTLFKSSLSADSTAVLTVLKESPCIFDSKKCLLVRPEQVVLRWKPDKEISPYLIRSPDELGEFVELFKQLGSTLDDATIEQYCMVLEMINAKTKKDRLDPNEKEAVCKATHGFFKRLRQAKEPMTLRRELFLPGIDERLHPSSEVIVNNNDRHRERIESFDRIFMIDLQECKLDWSDHELESNMRKLPAEYQPQYLTSVVMETLEEDFVEEESSFVRTLEAKLQSDQLKQGIVRIAVHCGNMHEKIDEVKIREAFDRLKDVQFVGVNIVRTYLVYQGKRIEESENTDQLFYIREELVEGQRRCTFFIKSTAMEQRYGCAVSALYHKLACSVQRALKAIMPYSAISYLEKIIQCDDMETGMMLDMLEIRRIKFQWLLKFERKFRPLPGQFVPMHLHHLLKQDILLLKIGDYVALEVDDPVDNVDSFGEGEPVNPTGGDVEIDGPDDIVDSFAEGEPVNPTGGDVEIDDPADIVDSFVEREPVNPTGGDVEIDDPVDNVDSFAEGEPVNPTGGDVELDDPVDNVDSFAEGEPVNPTGGDVELDDPVDNVDSFAEGEPVNPTGGDVELDDPVDNVDSFAEGEPINPTGGGVELEDPVDNIDSFAEGEPVNPTGGGVETDDRTSMQPTYILVKILDVYNKENGPCAATYRIEDGSGSGAKTVSAALLYAFHRTATDVQDVDAVLEVDDPEASVAVTLDEARREIRQTLVDTWSLRKDIRKKFVKRLLLKWHPDKHPDETRKLATEATKYIFELIDKLSKGIRIEDDLPSVPHSNSGHSYPSGDYYSGAYYSYMTQRARKHQMAQQMFRENYERNTENVDERRRRDFVDSFSSRNPQPGEGRRWLRQADCDLGSVANDGLEGKCPAAEWACFKCYQAAEKAVRGAQYARDSNALVGKDIHEMAEIFGKSELREWVGELLHLVRGPSYMQYPTEHHRPMIPRDAFSQETVQRTRLLGQYIVDWCRNYIG